MTSLCRALQSALALLLVATPASAFTLNPADHQPASSPRSRTRLDTDWRFHRFPSNPDNIAYDLRPDHANLTTPPQILKPWILPSANAFIADPSNHHTPPPSSSSSPPPLPTYASPSFNDTLWDPVTLPHDWAIAGPFYVGDGVPVGGGMGRLPSQGVGWYRRTVSIPSPKSPSAAVARSRYFLEFDGAMAYAVVWVDGTLVGGWPYGYNSFRVDVTAQVRAAVLRGKGEGRGEVVVAVRVDNPVQSSRWYPGGGLYRDVWLVTAGEVAVGQWGTVVTTREGGVARVETDVHEVEAGTGAVGRKVAEFEGRSVALGKGERKTVNGSVEIKNPRLWGPWPSQTPNLYVAVSRVYVDGKVVDEYSTEFGIRSLVFDSDRGLFVNGERVRIQGVNQHHDLGALGAAFNYRAAERQLQLLRELGCNAIRMSHNPPALSSSRSPTAWASSSSTRSSTPGSARRTPTTSTSSSPDWSEPDLRAFIRRDRNHPPSSPGASATRSASSTPTPRARSSPAACAPSPSPRTPDPPVTASMNYAKPTMPFPAEFDLARASATRPPTPTSPASRPRPLPAFHTAFPHKMIFSSETAAALSSRGTYLFPLTNETARPVSDTLPSGGGDPTLAYVSAYELYTAPFGSSADKVFASQDAAAPYVAGEFVWSGWDYLGEPTPYYSARSSYFGIVDLAGFKKDRAYLYQARWREDDARFAMVHVLPHWSWGAAREGEVTPVHAFASADEAELWVNGASQGRLRKEEGGVTSYRFRWDEVVYRPGEIRVVAYKGGKEWASETVKTAGAAAGLRLTADRETFKGDGRDLSFVTVEVVDGDGNVVPTAGNAVAFELEGPGQIAATDNGDPTDMTSFVSKERKVFNGLGLVIVRGNSGAKGKLKLKATGAGLKAAQITLRVQ
ncbi:hypothetical protein NEMBOFW57_004364 [Staphylotrichum longicolle]|uniref:Beta-galactosidase n=1 Tax=Staphylotrichum longicolle TaxID=669026 RepID=A0AAD4FBK7_9PEZI|nr:hypothetical protein NEMBOFW57_004364 [Staphylotrichum longicolle]